MVPAVERSSLVAFPRLSRIKQLVPSPFMRGYAWFMEHEGQHIDRLPFGEKGTPSSVGFPLARQSGIHSPRMNYPKRRYVIAVHSSDLNRYPDKEPIMLDDGTWLIDYSAQDGAVDQTRQDYNGWMMNCLRDAVPIGVMTKQPTGGYTVRGLAYIESYNPVSRMFLLHGPVNAKTESAGLFDLINLDELTRSEQKPFLDHDEEEAQRMVLRIQRRRQDIFRKELLEAYGCRCAITGVDVPEVLQAAHIEPYRGSRSQNVTNGILLRADIHLLYDAHLLSIKPRTYTVSISERIADSAYKAYADREIALPNSKDLLPDSAHLERRYTLYEIENYTATVRTRDLRASTAPANWQARVPHHQ